MMLLIGYGNPGRGDDGLGPDFAERMSARAVSGLEVVIDYQLKVEHALCVASATCVVFVDAQIGGAAPFQLAALVPARTVDVRSHALCPRTVLTLAKLLYGAEPRAFLLAISGTEFNRIHEGLSPTATRNLDEAERYFLDWLANNSTSDHVHGALRSSSDASTDRGDMGTCETERQQEASKHC